MLLSVLLPLSLAFIMFSLGVGLRWGDFRTTFTQPVAFGIGFVHQVLLLPVVVYAVVRVFGITGELAVGFMILAVCPGGVTSNVLAKLARGDVALSITLTSVTSLLSMVTVPIVLAFSFSTFLESGYAPINITSTALTMFLLTVVPVSLGMVFRAVLPALGDRLDRPLGVVATVIFVVVVVAGIAGNWQLLVDNFVLLGAAVLTLFAVLLPVGYAVPRATGCSAQQSKTISIDTGIQNSTLGIVVAALLVGQEGFNAFSIPAALYGIMMYFAIVPLVLWFRQR
ncbi:MAG: bile acid:sodium symporter [Pseudomonadota bacterium]